MSELEQSKLKPASRRDWLSIPRTALIRLTAGAVVAAVVLVVIARTANDLPGALDVLSDASLPWLAAAVAVQTLCYVLLGFQLARLVGGEVRLGQLLSIRLAVVVYGLGTLLPGAPAPGMVIAATELDRRGIRPGQAALAFFLSTWFNVRSFLVLAILTAATALLRGRVPDNSRALVLAGACFVGAALALTEAVVKRPALADRVGRILARVNWRGGGPAARDHALRLHAEAMGVIGSRRDGFLVASATLGSRLADAVCLRLALIAMGIHVSMGIVLIAYVASILISIGPLLPGGLGLVEATTPALLHHYGVSLDAAVAAIVAWRVVTLLLPGLVGLASYVSLRMQAGPTSPTGIGMFGR